MIILIFLLALSLAGIFKIDKKLEYLFWVVSFLVLFLFSGLRYDVGMDFSGYEELYNDSLYSVNSEINELGWAYLFYGCRNIGLPFSMVILVISFFTIYSAFVFIKRYSPYPFLSILIFFCFAQYYTYTFNAIRQCLVGYIFLLSLKYIEERNMIKYFVSIGLTFFFIHTSAVILLPLYFFIHRFYPLYIKLGLIAVFLLGARFFIILIASSPTYKIYLTLEQYAEEIKITSYLLIFIAFILLVLDSYIKDRTPQKNILFNISYLFLLCLTIACFFAGTPLVIVFMRLAFYFTPVLMVLLPWIVQRLFKGRSRYVIIFLISIIYAVLFCYTTTTGGEKNKLLPYKTIFSK
ncbi:MAG: EpsG family protein [Odoribacter sp.]